MLIIVIKIDFSRNSFWRSDTHLLISLRINIELEIIYGIMVSVVVRLMENNLSVLMNFNVWGGFTIHKSQLPECHHILAVFYLHE